MFINFAFEKNFASAIGYVDDMVNLCLAKCMHILLKITNYLNNVLRSKQQVFLFYWYNQGVLNKS